MRMRNLGRTGLIVSELCFGTMTFGQSQWNLGGVDQKTANEMVARAVDAGVNFFDTADVYSGGQAEEMLGQAIRGRREGLVIATKVRGRMGSGPNDAGLSRKHILSAIDQSLRRLDTDYVDLYQVHGWDALTPLEETLDALDAVVRSGKARYVGVSNYAAWQIALALGRSDCRHQARFISAQMHYSLLCRDIEEEVVPLLQDQGLGLLVWSPLSGGFLAGKYRRDAEPGAGTRFHDRGMWFPPFDRELGFQVVEKLREMAVRYQATPAQLALAWLLAKPWVSSVIIGARNFGQLEENLKAADVQITADDLAVLDRMTAMPARYPRWMIARQAGDR